MALFTTSTTTQPSVEQPSLIENNSGTASLLAALMLTMYAAQKSRKQIAKLKRKALLTLMKLRMQMAFNNFKSLFSKNAAAANISNRTLLYILLALAILILLFISWPAAVVLLLLGILLVLLMK